jgi:hypothetical protein
MYLDLSGLAEAFRASPQVLGHRGRRWVYDASGVRSALDEETGLTFFPIGDVFSDPDIVFLGVGRPNVYLVMPRAATPDKEAGWDKLAAFMFRRKPALIANTKGRVQSGILFQLRELPPEAVVALRREMDLMVGKRTASCAHAHARILTAAGFTCGGKSLRRIYRPSKLAALIWEHGLEYEGRVVKLRLVQTGSSTPDHFLKVWRSEVTSPVRTVVKQYARSGVAHAAPVFEPFPSVTATLPVKATGRPIWVGVSLPSRLGMYLGFLWGERPIFYANTGEAPTASELREPLRPFPGQLDRMTKIKKYVLFSRPVVWFIRRHVVKSIAWDKDVPAGNVAAMLRPSPGIGRQTAYVYNFVLTREGVRISRLKNDNGRDRKFINWIMAKHVILSAYSHTMLASGELWQTSGADGQPIVCINLDSGTYKPGGERLIPVAEYLSAIFDTEVLAVRTR